MLIILPTDDDDAPLTVGVFREVMSEVMSEFTTVLEKQTAALNQVLKRLGGPVSSPSIGSSGSSCDTVGTNDVDCNSDAATRFAAMRQNAGSDDSDDSSHKATVGSPKGP